jgi:hypothetical protein
MQRLKRIVIAIVAILLLVLGIGYLPGAGSRQSVVIRAPASPFSASQRLKRWRDWTVGTVVNCRSVQQSGHRRGRPAVGAREGRAVMKIMQSERDSLVAYTVLFNAGEFHTEGT